MKKSSVSPNALRRLILEVSKSAGVGHIGSALSIADIVAALLSGVLQETDNNQERDRFVLGKGHAALALYAGLHLKGALTREQLDTYCGDDSLLGVHPEHHLSGVDFSTGSLGQSLSIAAGSALGARMKQKSYRAFALLSDAELNEGAIWEAVMFAAHHQLSNLVAIVDDNGSQAFGRTREVLNLQPLAEKWSTFGWRVHCCDGHDANALQACLSGLDTKKGAPHVVLAQTELGKGVAYMEGQVKWHYLPMNDQQYAEALAGLGDS